jgi:hypothetical protein
MPMRTCWLVTTLGPIWKTAPPPVMSNWTVVLEPSVTVRLRSRAVVLSEMVLPAPAAV